MIIRICTASRFYM